MLLLSGILVLTILFGRLKAQECMGCEIFDEFTASCYGLGLTAIPDCLPKTLTYLDLWNNSISLNSSTFDSFPSLEMIFVNSNGLIAIPEDLFRNQPNLTIVNLNNNKLTRIPVNIFANNPVVETLYVSINYLEDLDVIFVPSSLKRVHAYFNSIENINSTVPINGNIIDLDISYNKLSTLDKNLFSDMQNVSLWIEKNPWNCDCALSELLDVFEQQRIEVQVTPFCATPPELAGVSISTIGNLCNVVFGKMKWIFFILFQLFQGSPAQECMNCTFYDVYTVYCDGLGLREVPTCLPDTVQFLDLWENSIVLTSSSFDHLPNLEYLHMDTNGMTSVPEDVFRNQKKLKLVNFTSNNLTSVPANLFAANPDMSEFYVVDNNLESVDIIFGQHSMYYVRASYNQLQTIDSSVPINENITSLDISDNKLSFLDKQLFVNNVNMSLWVEYNPWNCDCPFLLDLLHFFLERNIRVQVDPICETPAQFFNTSWSVAREICFNQTLTTALPPFGKVNSP